MCCTTSSWKGLTGRSKSEVYPTEIMMFTLPCVYHVMSFDLQYDIHVYYHGNGMLWQGSSIYCGCLFEWWVRRAPWPFYRDRHKALQQRFTSLQVSGNMWQDLAVMRKGVEIETTAMARRRLLMNYEWWVCCHCSTERIIMSFKMKSSVSLLNIMYSCCSIHVDSSQIRGSHSEKDRTIYTSSNQIQLEQ